MAPNVAKMAKSAIAVLLAGSILATAVPASAQYRGDHRGDYRGRHHDGIDAGDVIAGAIIIGGLAAILSSGSGRRGGRYDRNYDRNYDGYDWNRYGGSREAIQRCVSAVEHRGGRGDIDVQRITHVERIRSGYHISGQVAVDYRGGYSGDWRGDDRYGDRYGNRDDRYGNRDGRYGNHGDRGCYDDRGRFSCIVRYGRVEDVDFRGI